MIKVTLKPEKGIQIDETKKYLFDPSVVQPYVDASAENATKAEKNANRAEQTFANVSTFVDTSKSEITGIIEQCKNEIATAIDDGRMEISDSILDATEAVKKAGAEAAQEAVQGAADEATIIATEQVNTYVVEVVSPKIQEFVNNAEADASNAAESAGLAAEEANKSSVFASDSQHYAEDARIWAEGEQAEVQELGGELSSKGWANETKASASAAKTSETNAQASAIRSENSAVRAEEAKNLANEAVSKLGEFDSTVENAKEEIVSLSAAEQAVIVSNANSAKEVAVSEINSTKDTAIGEVEQAGSVIATYQYPIIPIAETSGSVSLATNTIYQMEITDAVAFVLPEVNTAVFNQIKVMAKITGTPTIDWGTTQFFNKAIPEIEGGNYDIYFDYDNLLGGWVCLVVAKGAGE